MTEYEVKLTEGFRTTEFTAEIQDITIKEIGEYDKIVFDFGDDESILSLFSLQNVVDGEVPKYTDLGTLVESLLVFNDKQKTVVDVTGDGQLLSIRFDPDIIGKTATFTPEETVKITKEGKKTYRKWRITKLEGLSENAPAKKQPANQPANQPDQPAKETSEIDDIKWKEWEEIINTLVTDGPTSGGDILRAMQTKYPDKAKQAALAKVRKPVLDQMVDVGYLKLDNNLYCLV